MGLTGHRQLDWDMNGDRRPNLARRIDGDGSPQKFGSFLDATKAEPILFPYSMDIEPLAIVSHR
jgi:hypothetical protein